MLDLRSDHWAVRAGFALAAVWAVAFMIRTSWPDPDYFPVDFKYFWLSGKLWLAGVTPYGPEMQALGAVHFPEERINPFFYPPNWRIIATPVALLPPDAAATVWAALSIASIAGACWQLGCLSTVFGVSLSRTRLFALYLFIVGALAHGAEIAVLIGQPAPFFLLGLTSLLTAVANSNRPLAIIALTALLLKPHLSIPIVAAAIFIPFLRIPIFVAGFATGLLALYGLGASSPVENFTAFLQNISIYGSLPENLPIHMSGPNFVFALINVDPLSPFVLLGLCIAVVAGAGYFTAKRQANIFEPETAMTLLIFAALASTALMSTHNFDFLAAAPAMLLWGRSTKRDRIFLLFAGFLIMRSMSLSILADGLIFAEKTSMVALFDTIGSLVLFFIALFVHAERRDLGAFMKSVFRAS